MTNIKSRFTFRFNGLVESAAKSIFGAVPMVGGLLNEAFFDYRSRIVQKRINAFVLSVQESMKELNINFDIERIQSEDFLDVFYLIITKVTEAKQDEKIEILKNVLINETIQPYKGGLRDSFINIAMTLQPKQIEILIGHSKIKHDPVESRIKLQTNDLLNMESLGFENAELSLERQAKLAENELLRQKLAEDMPYRRAATYGLSQTEYLYFSQDMIAKCLLCDIGVAGHLEAKPMEYFAITEYGKEFLNFLRLI